MHEMWYSFSTEGNDHRLSAAAESGEVEVVVKMMHMLKRTMTTAHSEKCIQLHVLVGHALRGTTRSFSVVI